MNGWIKWFLDGTKEIGSDIDVALRKVSWSRGRLTGMAGAEIVCGDKRIAILVPGEFWQSDDWEVNVLSSQDPVCVTRRIQRKIRQGDILAVHASNDSICIMSGILDTKANRHFIPSEEQEGKWLTVEVEVATGVMQWSLEETMI